MPDTLRGPYLITTSPSLTECHRCGAPVLAATVAGLDRHVGWDALTDLGKLAAVLAGRRLYALVGRELIVLDAAMIEGGRFDAKPVLADHTCTPLPPGQVDPEGRAVALVVAALGGVVVAEGGRHDPAPY